MRSRMIPRMGRFRPRRPPPCRWPRRCAPICRQAESASSTLSPGRSTMNGMPACRHRSFRPRRSPHPSSMRSSAVSRMSIRARSPRILSRAFSTIPRRSSGNSPGEDMSSPILAHLVSDLVAGRIRVVDLTHTLAPEFPPIVLPPEFGESAPVRIEEVSRYDARGPAWYWNNLSFGEHTGTHFDAPIHWVTGRDLPNNATDTILLDRFIASASVIDCSREAAEDADYLLTVAKLRAFEERHGRILPRSWVLMRTDWSKRRDPVAFQNFDEAGQHTP